MEGFKLKVSDQVCTVAPVCAIDGADESGGR